MFSLPTLDSDIGLIIPDFPTSTLLYAMPSTNTCAPVLSSSNGEPAVQAPDDPLWQEQSGVHQQQHHHHQQHLQLQEVPSLLEGEDASVPSSAAGVLLPSASSIARAWEDVSRIPSSLATAQQPLIIQLPPIPSAPSFPELLSVSLASSSQVYSASAPVSGAAGAAMEPCSAGGNDSASGAASLAADDQELLSGSLSLEEMEESITDESVSSISSHTSFSPTRRKKASSSRKKASSKAKRACNARRIPKDVEFTQWPEEVLVMGTKERNDYRIRNNLTQKQFRDLCVMRRRYQTRKAQERRREKEKLKRLAESAISSMQALDEHARTASRLRKLETQNERLVAFIREHLPSADLSQILEN